MIYYFFIHIQHYPERFCYRFVLWNKRFQRTSYFFLRYLHDNIAMLLIPRVQNRGSASKTPLITFLLITFFTILHFVSVTHFTYKWNLLNSKPIPRHVLIKGYNPIFMTRNLFLWSENKIRVFHTKQWFSKVIRFLKITPNLTQDWQKTHKSQKDEKLVFQKNRWKMQTCINPYWRK